MPVKISPPLVNECTRPFSPCSEILYTSPLKLQGFHEYWGVSEATETRKASLRARLESVRNGNL